MLALNDLIQFSEAYKDANSNIEANLVVADDSEVSKMITNLFNDANNCTLITVVPSHDSEVRDEDTRQMRNNLIFMIVKKTDHSAGNPMRLSNLALCQTEIQKLHNHILDIKDDFSNNCLFKNLDYTNMPITPISDYFGQVGYMLEVFTRTDL